MRNEPAIEISNNGYDLLEKALCILQDGVSIVSRRYCIIYINEAASLMFQRQIGFAPKAGDNILDFVRPEWKSTVKAHIEDAFLNRIRDYEINYPQNGKEFWLELGFHPMP